MLTKLPNFIALLLFYFFIFPNSVRAEDEIKIIHLKGQIKIIDKYGAENFNVKNGDRYSLDSTIVTLPKSIAIIRYNDSTIKIDENSSLSIESKTKDIDQDLRERRYNLQFGTILFFYAKKSIEGPSKTKEAVLVKMKSTSLGVRGTLFIAHQDSSSGAGFGAVKEGKVQVSNLQGDKNLLLADQGLTFNDSGKLGMVRRYPWINKINWDITNLDQIIDPSEISKVIQKLRSNPGGSSSVDEKLDIIFMKECKKGNPHACGEIAHKTSSALSLLEASCSENSMYSCYRLGQLMRLNTQGNVDSPILNQKVQAIATKASRVDTNLTAGAPREDLEESCFKQVNNSCLYLGHYDGAQSDHPTSLIKIGTGQRHELVLILSKYCEKNDVVGCTGLKEQIAQVNSLMKLPENKKYIERISPSLINRFKSVVSQHLKNNNKSAATSTSSSSTKASIKNSNDEEMMSDSTLVCKYKGSIDLIKSYRYDNITLCYAEVLCLYKSGSKVFTSNVSCHSTDGSSCPDALKCMKDQDIEITTIKN